MGDLYDLAPELGLPTKEELATYIDYAHALDLPTKFGLFLLIICAEKVTLVGEILPVGVVLPSLSPVLFGGVLQGTLISAFCAAVGASLLLLDSRTHKPILRCRHGGARNRPLAHLL